MVFLLFSLLHAFAAPLDSDRLADESRQASPKQLWAKLNSGWSPSYEALGAGLKNKNYLYLSATEPGTILDLRSADHFRRSILSTVLTGGEVDIGHVWLGWKCGSKMGQTGQAGNAKNQFMDMVKGGWGLAAFRSQFLDGFLETPSYIEMEDVYDDASFHTLVMEVSPKECAKAMKFVADYVNHPKQPRAKYGLEGKPSTFEGGGCGSFAITALEKAGIFGGESPFWRTLVANGNLFGFGLPHSTEVQPFEWQKGTRSISLLPLFAGNWTGSASDPTLTLVDPELVNLWIKTLYREREEIIRQSGGEALQKVFAKPGNLNLFQHRALSATVKIDESFDEPAAKVVKWSKDWLAKNKYAARILWVEGHPALVLEKSSSRNFSR